MNKIIVHAILALFMSMNLNAQSSYEDNMSLAFELWDANKDKEAANLFQQIAGNEKENWLPYYYASQVKIVQSFALNDQIAKEKLLEEAQQLLHESKTAGGDEIELMVLQAMLHTSRLTMDPLRYGRELSPVITGIYATASDKAPQNPRVVLERAEWNIGSARFHGEDPAKYCSELKQSLELFEKEEAPANFTPIWGADRAKKLISQICIQ